MKKFILSIFILFTACLKSQCRCDSAPDLQEIIHCEVSAFDNQASVFWNYNCDSSWLSYRSPTGHVKVLYALTDLKELTGRLGYSFAFEYRSTFLIQNNLISGSCAPPEFLLFDKYTGKQLRSLGSIIYYSDNRAYPFIVSFATTAQEKYDLNNLALYNIDKNKSYKIKLPPGEITAAMKQTGESVPEYMFEENTIKNGKLKLVYRIRNGNDPENLRSIGIDLSEY